MVKSFLMCFTQLSQSQRNCPGYILMLIWGNDVSFKAVAPLLTLPILGLGSWGPRDLMAAKDA